MNTRTMITAATWLATAAAAFSGCAAEEVVSTPNGSSPTNVGPVSGNTGGGTGPSNTTTISTAAAVTNTNAVGSTGTTSTGGAAVTTTTGGAAGPVTNAAGPVTNAAAVTSGGAAASGNSGNSGSSGGGGCEALAAAGTAPLIDDFADDDHIIAANEGRVGYWYQYGDTGDQVTTPLEDAAGSDGVLHSSGSGFTDYVGFGVDLNNGAGEPCEYDASAHTGIQFDITSDVAVTFQVALPATKADSDHYGIAVPASAGGTTFKAAFTALEQPDWGTATAWDAGQILQLQWQVTTATEDFDITIDNVTFY